MPSFFGAKNNRKRTGSIVRESRKNKQRDVKRIYLTVFDQIERQGNLKKLGFENYAAYLASPLWSSIRKRVLARDSCTCVICSGEASVVHHMSYDYQTLSGEDLGRLLSICDDCHERVHKNEYPKKKKRTKRRKGRKPQNSKRQKWPTPTGNGDCSTCTKPIQKRGERFCNDCLELQRMNFGG